MARIYYEIPHGKWLRENIDKNKTNKELLDAFNLEFNFNLRLENFRIILSNFGIKRKNGFRNLINEEEGKWLEENAYKYNDYQDIANDFNKVFKTNYSTLKVMEYCQSKKIRKQNKNNIWTEEQLNFLIENIEKYETFKNLTDAFNQQFDKNMTILAIKTICNRKDIHKVDRMKLNFYSEEIKKFIMDNMEKYTNYELAEIINDKFDYNTTGSAVESFLSHRNIKRKNKHYRMVEIKKIGEEIIKHDIVYVKVKNTFWKELESKFGNWRRKAHVLYEQYNNVKIDDKKQMVIHLDNNKFNFEKDNLVLLDKNVAKTYHSKRTGYKFDGIRYNKVLVQMSQLEHIIKKYKEEEQWKN